MRYRSTRGSAPPLGFCDAILTGLAPDGGLYLPETWPKLTAGEIETFGRLGYAEIAFEVFSRFTDGEIADAALRRLIDEACGTFRHPAVAPLVQIGANHFLLELFHGPTLAFKDVAMQVLARLMDHVLAERDTHATIVGATSGDTGGAAIEAFAGRERVAVTILFPDGRVSPVQRRQMTTVAAPNCRAIAIEGTFDDCQALVKAMFADRPFRERMALSAVNSINWGRIVAQAVYYFAAATALGAPHRPVSFTVPTGNFGNIFAAWVAARMGLRVDKLVIATNRNDILHRAVTTGRYETGGVVATQSPSMDIEVSSNFERLLFEAGACEPATVRRQMSGLAQSGAFVLDEAARTAIERQFVSGACDEAGTTGTIAATLRATGLTVDPHTAVGLCVADRLRDPAVPMVTLATAHPAKFPEAVEAATGARPALPAFVGDLMEREERYDVLPADLSTVEDAIANMAGAGRPAAIDAGGV